MMVAAAAVLLITAVFGYNIFYSAYALLVDPPADGTPLILYAFEAVCILGSVVLLLVTGILGVRYCYRPAKAMVCIILALITVVFFAGLIFAGVAIVDTYRDVVIDTNITTPFLVVSFILAGVYLAGAVLNRRAAKANAARTGAT